jgi:hypothetical protein
VWSGIYSNPHRIASTLLFQMDLGGGPGHRLLHTYHTLASFVFSTLTRTLVGCAVHAMAQYVAGSFQLCLRTVQYAQKRCCFWKLYDSN